MTQAQNDTRVKDGIDEPTGARERAQHAYDAARDKAQSAVDASKRRAHDAAEAIEATAVAMLVGGLAVGALAATVIPRSAREKELLAPVGKRVGAAAAAAFAAAKVAGQDELSGLGLSRDAARGQARSLFDGVVKAATAAGRAGVDAGKQEVRSR